MITNNCAIAALSLFEALNAHENKWASFEASVPEGYCRVKVGHIHTDGTKELHVKIYNFKDVNGVIEVSSYGKN